MSKGIVLDIPQEVYVAYESDKTVENEFYFIVYKEYLSPEKETEGTKNAILIAPTIYVEGFEQFFETAQLPPEEQEAQVTADVTEFINSLVFSDMVGNTSSSWSVTYDYNCKLKKRRLKLLLTYTGDGLSQDFKIKISSNRFICNNQNTLDAIVLEVYAEGFEEFFPDIGKCDYYNISCSVRYAPYIKKFVISYDKTEYSEDFFVNPNQDNKIVLSWEIAGNGPIEHSLKKDGEYIKAAYTTDSIEDTVEKSALYTLEATNRKGFYHTAQIRVNTTKWLKVGAVTGLFSDDSVFEDMKNSMRILSYKGCYYCYIKDCLYKSDNGLSWSVFSKNDAVSENEDFDCTSCAVFGNILYVMMGKEGGRLRIILYDFLKNEWKSSSAYQNCISCDGNLGLSEDVYYYAQTLNDSVTVFGHRAYDDWQHWNRESFVISADNVKAICSDLCFWKDRFYAAMLCDDNKVYFIECNYQVKDAIFNYKTGKNNKIFLLPTTNKLFIVLNGMLLDTSAQEAADDFFPPDKAIPWVGSDKEKVFGIFSDRNFWTYIL